ncbi:hypothetical protein [Dactylosporangium sp. CA-092794]|uniref:hypothetical protein n=1 Tax=Dactylosporangium sp. CA-092794 TaxID=3239929 RepID=UPI003D93E0CC
MGGALMWDWLDVIPGVQPIRQAVGSALSSAGDSVASGTVDWFARESAEVVAQMLRMVLTGWVYVPPNNAELSTECTASGGLFGGGTVSANCQGPIYFIQSHTYFVLAAVAIGALFVGAVRIMWQRDGKDAAAMGKSALVLVFILGAGIPTIGMVESMGHTYSVWIVDQSVSEGCPQYQHTQDLLKAQAQGTGPAAQKAQQQLDAQGQHATGPDVNNPCTLGDDLLLRRLPDNNVGTGVAVASPLLLVFMDTTLILALLVQVLMKAARGAALALVVAFWAIMRALGLGGRGGDRPGRQVEAWLITLLLWEPVAATIDAFSLRMVMQPDFMSVVYGLIGFFVALLAMPTLHRLAAPITTIALGDLSGNFAARGRGAGALDLTARALGARIVGLPSAARVVQGAANVGRAGRRIVADAADQSGRHIPGGKP